MYILIIKIGEEIEGFEFPTKEGRDQTIQELEKMSEKNPEITWATAWEEK